MKVNKRIICTFDTETTELRAGDTCRNPLIFDIAWAIHDKKGHVLHTRAFIIKDVFLSPLMQHAFYGAKKMPVYLDWIASGERELISFADMLAIMADDCRRFGVDTLAAYNLAFDVRALRRTCQHLCLSESLLEPLQALERLCIWQAQADTVGQFTYQMWCVRHGIRTEKRNNKSSAEALGWFYGFLAMEEAEDHTALCDVLLEVKLLAKAYSKRKRISVGKAGNWSSFQRRRLSEWGRLQYDIAGAAA